jgi:hypothetical protein
MSFGPSFQQERTAPITILGPAAQHAQQAYQPDAPNFSHKDRKMTMIFRIISKSTGQILKEHRLMCMPMEYSATPESRSQIQYTAGGVHFDKIGLLGLTRFQIRGHTLFRGQTLPSGMRIDGMAHWRDLSDTFEFYFTGNCPKPVVRDHDSADLMMTFIDESWPVTLEQPAPPEWVIHPDAQLVQLNRRQDKPFLYFYGLNFQAYKRNIVDEVASLETLDLRPQARSLYQRLQHIAREMTSIESLADLVMGEILGPQGLDFLQQARNYRSLVFTAVDIVQNFVAGTEALIDDTFERIHSVIAAGETLRNSAISLADLAWGGQITGEHANLLNEIRHIRRRMNSLLLLTESFGSASQNRIQNYLRVRDNQSSLRRGTSLTAQLLDRQSVATRVGLDPAELLRFDTLAEFDLQRGDTIDSLAGQLGIDPNLLAALNNLRFPFVNTSQQRPDTDPYDPLGRNVLYFGDNIILPVQQQPANPSLNQIMLPADIVAGTEGREFSLEERLFGSDLALDDDGDLVVNDATKDLQTRSGTDNLLQSYRIGFKLRLGGLNHYPSYGNYTKQEVGSGMTRPTRELVALGALKTIMLNPRTAQVTRLKVTASRGRMDIEADIAAIGGVRISRQQFRAAGSG